jgi:hypothetical protein
MPGCTFRKHRELVNFLSVTKDRDDVEGILDESMMSLSSSQNNQRGVIVVLFLQVTAEFGTYFKFSTFHKKVKKVIDLKLINIGIATGHNVISGHLPIHPEMANEYVCTVLLRSHPPLTRK